VALSLYDTLPEVGKFKIPVEALTAYAPMLAAFIQTNWQPAARFVVGLSALGRPLDPEKADAEFVDSGPTEHGWIVKPDGNKTPDLTWPLTELIA
jgi:hypothetical protein